MTDQTCPRCAARSGGPYTTREFVEKIGVVEPTGREAETDEELVALAAAVEEAETAYNAADETWRSAVLAAIGADKRQGQEVDGSGNVKSKPTVMNGRSAAQEDERDAAEERQRASVKLSRARARYYERRQMLTTRRAEAEYRASIEAAEADREDEQQRRFLRRTRDRLRGAA